MKFQPDAVRAHEIKVPFFEDARSADAPGVRAVRPLEAFKSDVIESLGKLGATDISITSGKFEYNKPGVTGRIRYGYLISFTVYGQQAQMQIAGLPMRQTDTQLKREQVQRQALYIVNLKLKSAISSLVFSPGAAPLIQYVLVPGTEHTVSEYIATARGVPNMNPQLPGGER